MIRDLKLGDFRQQVDHQTVSTAQDAYGQAIETWSSAGTYYAAIYPGVGREFVVAEQLKAKNPVTIIVRYCGGSDVFRPKDRLLLGSRVFNIEALSNLDERNYAYSVMCTEMT